MDYSESAAEAPSFPSQTNAPPESSKITPSSAQPPPYDYDLHFPSLNSTANCPPVPPKVPTSDVPPPIPTSEVSLENRTSEILDGSTPISSDKFHLPTSENSAEPRKASLGSYTSSFSYPSPFKPEHKHLKATFSSPALPCQADDADDTQEIGKYAPHTRSPSDGCDVRWYFCKTPLGFDEAAASVPPTELVGKGEYFRFSKSDSDALEAAFLEREEELVRAWWKEYAESREGPTSSHDGHPVEPGRLTLTDRNDFESFRRLQLSSWEEGENVGVLVKGGLYEVDLLSRRCLPVYWRGDHRRVLRGHWFARKGGLDWLPLREDLSEQLEIAYESQIWRRRRFQPSGLYAARVNLHGATQGLHALFTGEDDSWEAWLCVDTTGISFVLGLRGSGVKLRRGFALPEAPQPTQDEVRQHKEEEMDDYASKVPVRHVVFMVHGIGQRLEKANLVDDVGSFRRSVAMLAEQHLTQYQRDSQRILFIPCQWRRELKLGGESAVEDCTLEGVRALRTMLSATVHDVLYYMSPVYCQDIIDSVSRSLNRLYGKFIKRNPKYDGKVSIYGHSLGTVLSYDILCHQTDDSSTSTAPIVEVKPDVQQAAKEVPLSDGSGSENLPPEPKDSHRELFEECSQENLESEKSGEGECSHTGTELDHSKENDLPIERECSQNSQVELTEVDALKAEVRMLQEKLNDLMQDKSVGKESESSPLPASTSESLGNDDAKEPDKQGGGFGHPQASSNGNKGEGLLDNKFSSKKHFTPYISYTKLNFKVDTFYAVGSPLGVFLSLRNIRIGEGLGQEYWQDDAVEEEMPAVRQMMNIFHPYDPVAYRIEPLICREFVKKRPAFIPYHKGGKRLHIGMQEFQEDLSARSKAIVNSLSSVGTRVVSAFSSTPPNKSEDEEVSQEKTYGALMMERLTGGHEGRVDYQLQDSTFEHPYIAVLSSHTQYWHDLDTALFILKHLYRDIPQEPPAPAASLYANEENGLGVIREDSEVQDFSTSDEAAQIIRSQDDSDPEELSLTFSSKDAIAAVLADASKVKADWMG